MPAHEACRRGRGYPTREAGSIGASVGRLGEMVSPEDRPVRRRCTHGTAACGSTRAFCARTLRAGSARGAVSAEQLLESCGDAEGVEHLRSPCAGGRRVRGASGRCPSSPSRGTSRIRQKSTSRVPCRSADLADGLGEEREPSAHAAGRSPTPPGSKIGEQHDGGTGGDEPAHRFVVRRGEGVEVDPRSQDVVGAGVDVTRSGSRASAGSSCSSRIGRSLRPRMARLA